MPFDRGQSIQKIKKMHLGDARRSVAHSRHAHINWAADTYPRLRRLLTPLEENHASFPHLFFVSSEPTGSYHFQVNAVSVAPLRPMLPVKEGTSSLLVREQDAALVYAMHTSGAISVRLYPHSSDWGRLDKDSVVIDHFDSPDDLAGTVGNARIVSHAKLFLKLARRSMAVQPPVNDNFLENLYRSGERYENFFESRQEARKAWTNTEVSLGAGLLGGLIASSIIPFAQGYGMEKRALAKETETVCKDGKQYKSFETCLAEHTDYPIDRWVGKTLSTGNLLIFALILSLVVVRIMRSLLRRR